MSIEKIKELRELTGAGMLDVKKALEASNDDIKLAVEWLRVNGISKAAKKSNRVAAEGSIFISKDGNKIVMAEINSETDFVSTNERFVEGSNKIIDAILKSSITSNDIEGALELEIDGEKVKDSLINMTATIGEKITLRRFVVIDNEDSKAFYKHSNGNIGVIVTGKDIEEDTLRDVAMHAAAMSPEFLSKDDIPEETIKHETELAKEELATQLEGKPDNVKENIIKGKVNKIISANILLEQPFVKDSSKKVKDLKGSGEFKSFVRFEVGEGIEKKEENFAEEVARQING